MADDRVEIEIVLDDGKVAKGFAKIEKDAASSAKAAGDSFESGFTKPASKGVLALTAAIAAAGYAAVRIMKSSVDEAKIAENAMNSLQAAFRAQGIAVGAASSRFAAYASSLQNITTVGDDAIIQNAALLVSVGKLRGEGLEKATKAALDLSAGLGIELGSAFELVSKAAAGNAGSLGRYGIKVGENIPKSQQFAVALEKINQAFGGMAEAKVNTFSGAMDQMKNRFSDLLQSLGEFITKSPAVTALVKALADQFLKLTGSFDGIRKSGDVMGDLIKKGLEFGQVFIKYVVAPVEFFYNAAKFAFYAVAASVQALLVIIVDFANLLTQLVFQPIIAFVSGMGKLASFVNKDLAKGFESVAEAINVIPDATKAASEITRGALNELNAHTEEAANKLFDFSASDKASQVVSNLQEVVEAAKPMAEELGGSIGNSMAEGFQKVDVFGGFKLALDGMSAAAKEFSEKGVENFKKIGAAMFQTLGNAAGQAFSAFGRAIATGENAIGAFLNSLLASFGQAAVQLGTQFMLQGAAYMWAGMPNGGALISAGAALATFGGVLSGLGGGTAQAQGGGVAASATSGDVPGLTPDLAQRPETEEPKKQTAVTVNVQGNILDRRESGMAIVDVLNEYFSANDGRLVMAT